MQEVQTTEQLHAAHTSCTNGDTRKYLCHCTSEKNAKFYNVHTSKFKCANSTSCRSTHDIIIMRGHELCRWLSYHIVEGGKSKDRKNYSTCQYVQNQKEKGDGGKIMIKM